MPARTAIVGVGMTETTAPHKQTKPKNELCQLAVSRALEHAGLEIGQVDTFVFGSLDGFEATNLPAKFMGGGMGSGYGIPVLHVNTGGSTGGNLVNVANALVGSGQANTAVCVGPPSFDGPADLQAVINTASPFVIEQPLGIGAIHMGSLYAAAYAERYGATDEDFARIAVKNYKNAFYNPYAHLRRQLSIADVLESRYVTTPLRFRTTCPVSSGASAIVIANDHIAPRLSNPPVWIRSAGSSGDTYLGGGRHDFSRFENFGLLAERMFRRAGIKRPREELDVLELFSPYAPFEMLQLEAMRVVGEGEAIDFVQKGLADFGGELPVNVSGGVLCSNPGVAAQLAPYGYAAWQLMEQAAGGRQIPNAKRAVAHSTGGNFFQFHTFAVLERD